MTGTGNTSGKCPPKTMDSLVGQITISNPSNRASICVCELISDVPVTFAGKFKRTPRWGTEHTGKYGEVK